MPGKVDDDHYVSGAAYWVTDAEWQGDPELEAEDALHEPTLPFSPEVRIPLHGRGGVIHTYVKVDADDLHWLQQHRWFLSDTGYAYRSLKPGERDNRTVKMHREILGLTPGDDLVGDHINGDTLDNRRSNLRAGSHADNLRNFRRSRPGSTSPFRGVFFCTQKQRWAARATFDGKQHWLGGYHDELVAARAVNNFWKSHGYDEPNDVEEPDRSDDYADLACCTGCGARVNPGPVRCPLCAGALERPAA